MNKMLLLALSGAALLSSCSVIGTRAAAVSGQVRGFPVDQNLGLALVGFNNGQYVANGQRAQVIDKLVSGGYTLSLPRNVAYGTYRVVVFRDANSNGTYDAGDTVLSRSNNKLLIYAPRDNYLFNGTTYGWNIYNSSNGDIQTNILNNYDIDAAN